MNRRYKTFLETVVEVPLSIGRLIGRQRISRCVDAYGPLPRVLQRTAVFCAKDGKEKKIVSLHELFDIDPSFHLREEICRAPKEWARLVAFLHDVGMVLTPGLRGDLLARDGLDVKRLAPAIKGNCLVFFAIKLGVQRDERPIYRVSVNTRELDTRVKKLLTLEELRAGKRHRSIVA